MNYHLPASVFPVLWFCDAPSCQVLTPNLDHALGDELVKASSAIWVLFPTRNQWNTDEITGWESDDGFDESRQGYMGGVEEKKWKGK